MKQFLTLCLLSMLLAVNAYSQPKQFLHIEFSPADATLEINGVIKQTVNGIYQELLPLGQYQYKTYREGYRTECGTIDIKDPFNATRSKIKMVETYGYLTVERYIEKNSAGEIKRFQNTSQTKIYIDDELFPDLKLPISNLKLACGKHTLKITDPLFETNCTEFEINDDSVADIIPQLTQTHIYVTFTTDRSASIYIDDILQDVNKQTPHMLAIGKTYNIESRKHGHANQRITYIPSVGDNYQEIYVPEPTPIYGILEITSNPTNAKVYIDGTEVGNTPLSHNLHPGKYTIYVELEDYGGRSQPQIVSVVEGNQSISFEIPYGSLSITSNPSNAKIFHHGRLIGVTPIYIPNIMAKEYTFTAKFDSGEEINKRTSIAENEDAELSFEEEYGSLIITLEGESCDIYIDNRYIGLTPVYIPKILVGEHQVTLLNKDYHSQTKTVSIHNEKETIVTFGASILIKSDPSDATVYIDGEIVGKTPGAFTVFEGAHEIKVMTDGFEYYDEINIQGGERLHVNYKLEPKLEQKPKFQGKDANHFVQWVNSRIIYPEIARENGVQGIVTVQYTIDKNGAVTKIKVLRGVDPSLDKEVIRVITMSPKWTPGKLNGKPCAVTYTMPITFSLR